jgi:hypothetical protein
MGRRNIGLSLAAGLALVGGQSAYASDYWDVGTITDNHFTTHNELTHGTSQQHDLEVNGGAEGIVADQDWYIVASYPTSSYEAVIDGTSGDIGFVVFERYASDGTTFLGDSSEANPTGGAGFSRSMRWQNTATGGLPDKQFLRVQSGGCTTDCSPAAQYHIRFYETTVSVPRFNNASSQVTVLIIQNSTTWTTIAISGIVYFWDVAGNLLDSFPFSKNGSGALVLNTATVAGAAGQGGTITIAHDGGYGNLAVKAVALEPATGFSFDSPGLYKPH